jgi:glycosyltransferase involved in cell wall biosynthesis
MRISYFNYHYDIEGIGIGAATQVRAIAQALGRLGHQVDLQFRAARRPGQARDYLGLKQVAWARRYGHVPRLVARNLRFIPEEVRLLDAFKPDVVLAVSALVNFSILTACRLKKVPFALFSEAPMEYEYGLFFPQYYRYPWLSRGLEGVNVRAAAQVVCISDTMKGYLMRYGPPASKLHVIPNGVDHQAFAPGPPDAEIMARLDLKNRLVIGYIGSFEYFAHAEQFLSLARHICQAHPKAAFLLVGGGRRLAPLADAVAAAGLAEHFILPGQVPHDQVPRYLSVMDLVLSPYREDYLFYNSPMKLLEYMAAGKATLSPALGQIKELVHDGYNGLLHQPGDADGMGRKLLELIGDRKLRTRLGANARTSIERGWTWDHQAARLARVLESAIQGS